jgi:hypothetical protein
MLAVSLLWEGRVPDFFEERAIVLFLQHKEPTIRTREFKRGAAR